MSYGLWQPHGHDALQFAWFACCCIRPSARHLSLSRPMFIKCIHRAWPFSAFVYIYVDIYIFSFANLGRCFASHRPGCHSNQPQSGSSSDCQRFVSNATNTHASSPQGLCSSSSWCLFCACAVLCCELQVNVISSWLLHAQHFAVKRRQIRSACVFAGWRSRRSRAYIFFR